VPDVSARFVDRVVRDLKHLGLKRLDLGIAQRELRHVAAAERCWMFSSTRAIFSTAMVHFCRNAKNTPSRFRH
jgi:hypothetical protein